MFKNFDKDDLLQAVKEEKVKKSLYHETIEKIHELNIRERISHSKLFRLENKSNQLAMVEYKKLNIFGKIANFFHIGSFYKETKQIDEDIIEENKNITELTEQLNNLHIKAEQIKSISWEKNSPFEEHDGELVINDKGFQKAETEFEQLTGNDIIVHCTDFFPKNHTILSHFERKRIGKSDLTYHGVTKEVKAISPRREVHFTINNRVRNIDEGSMDNPKYIILEDLKNHRNEIENLNVSDSWTKGSNLKISNDAIILIDYRQKDDLDVSPEELKDYNIVYFDGDSSKCLNNFFKSNNYPIYSMNDSTITENVESVRMRIENAELFKNLALNYMSDNNYLSGEINELSEEDALRMLDIATDQYNTFLSSSQLNQIGVSEEKFMYVEDFDKAYNLVNFITCSGFYKLENGNYGFKPYDEILENATKLDENPEELTDFVDKNFIVEMFDKLQLLKAKDASKPQVTIDEANQFNFEDLYKFKNQSAAETVFKSINDKDIYLELLENGAIVSKFLPSLNKEIISKVKQSDNINLSMYGVDYGQIQTKFDGKQKPNILPESIKNLEEKFIEISQREDDYIK